MRFLVGIVGLLIGLPAALLMLLRATLMLGDITPGTWVHLNLPAATGQFLQACCVLAGLYLLWLLAGVVLQLVAGRVERSGRFLLASRLRRLSPRLVSAVAISAINAGVLVGTATPPTMALAAPVAGELPTHRAESNSAAAAAGNNKVELPVPTWVPKHAAVAFDRTMANPSPRAVPRQLDREVIVQKGDTLWDIARTRLGPQAGISDIAAYWPRIHQLNRDVIGPDPNLLHIGAVLLLPTPGP